MPAIASGKVLVTGANGFCAIWVVHALLEHGFSVRGAVRSESKAEHLRQTFALHGDKLELVIVPDMASKGAFDKAVEGVDAIAHTASPVTFIANDPDELIVPAVYGATRVLESALAMGTSVKRVVITSSIAAVQHPQEAPVPFTEDDWNDAAVLEVRAKGRAAEGFLKYCASKTLAEHAAWDFVEKNKNSVGFDLVVLNPPFVYGPVIHEANAAAELNTTMHDWFYSVFMGSKDAEQLSNTGSSWIDARDLGEAHVLAINKEAASGHRILVSEGPFKWQDFVNAAHEAGVQTAESDATYDPAKAIHLDMYDASKAVKLLGMKNYRSIRESTADMANDFKMKGWI